MGFYRRITQGPLSGYVEAVWLAEGYVQPHARERVLPTGTMSLIVDLSSTGRA